MNTLFRRFTIITLIAAIFALGLTAAVEQNHRLRSPYGAGLTIR